MKVRAADTGSRYRRFTGGESDCPNIANELTRAMQPVLIVVHDFSFTRHE